MSAFVLSTKLVVCGPVSTAQCVPHFPGPGKKEVLTPAELENLARDIVEATIRQER